MRYLINYFRQCFCKHIWIAEEGFVDESDEIGGRKGIKVYMRCTKCGYHQKHWKFL